MLAPRILLADDDPHLVQLIRYAVLDAGLRLTVARNGDDAYHMAILDRPDMIILDVNMPRLSGLEVLKALRRDPSLDDVPIMMLTGVRDEVAVRTAIEAGATDFLAKPFRPDLLMTRVLKHLTMPPQAARQNAV